MYFTPFSLSGLITFLTTLILIAVTIRYCKTNIQKVWSLFTLSICIWGLGSFFIGKTLQPQEAFFWWKIGLIGVIFIPVFFYHTVWLLCGLEGKKLLIFSYIQGAFFLVLDLTTNLFIQDVEFKFNSFYYDKPGPFYFYFFIIWLALVSYSCFELYRAYRSSTGIKKKRIAYFFVAVFCGFIGGIPNFLPKFNINIYPYGNFFISLYSVLAAYAIFRYRLLDIYIVITRLVTFILLYPLAVGIPIAIIYWKKDGLIKSIGLNEYLFLLILSTSLIATALTFLFTFIQHKAENMLQINQRRSYQKLLKISKKISLIKDMHQLITFITNAIQKNAEITYCAVYLLDKKKEKYIITSQKPELVRADFSIHNHDPLIKEIELSKNLLVREELEIKGELLDIVHRMDDFYASAIVPAFVEKGLYGFLVIGDKLSGYAFSEEDLEIYATLASQTALSIENARFFIEIERTQAELFQTAKMSSLGTLASGMGHQINNRLQAIRLIIDTVLSLNFNVLDKNSRSYLQMAIENIEQANNTIETLREHAKPSGNGYIPVSLNYVLDKSLEMVRLKKGKHFDKILIDSSITDETPMIIGDSSQLQEIFFNLLDNAYDAVQEAKVKLYKNNHYLPKISIHTQSSDNDNYLHINVEDNGIGISEENLKKLFVPFHTTKATVNKGTGLGLYVIERIVKGHGGLIKVESHYGRGTKFIVSLKRA